MQAGSVACTHQGLSSFPDTRRHRRGWCLEVLPGPLRRRMYVYVCMWECVCLRSVAGTAIVVRMTLDLGVGLPGMGLFKILHKVTLILVSSFISKHQIGRLLYLLSVSQCPFSPEPSSLKQSSWLSHLGVRNKKQWAWDSWGSRDWEPGAGL